MNKFLKYLWFHFLLILSLNSYAQPDSSRYKLIKSITNYIKNNYVSFEIGKEMSDSINWRFDNNKYDTSLNNDELLYEITKDLRRISKDEHISITTSELATLWHKEFDERRNNLTPKQQAKYYRKYYKKSRKLRLLHKKTIDEDMFKYGEIKILSVNIGYVEIKGFECISLNRKNNKHRIKLKSVIHFLSKTSSIIIDLRDNRGGYLNMANKLCSYFSPSKQNYFITSELHMRWDSFGTNKEYIYINKFITSAEIDNRITKDKNIYILTSHRTFSAAELTAYKIKQYNQATKIIGEKTYGGGNSHDGGSPEEHFYAVIPSSKIFDEKNNNYSLEAKGIIPDILVPADSALNIAYSNATNGSTNYKRKKVIYLKEDKLHDIRNQDYFKQFYKEQIGDYRKIKIICEDDKLFMVYDKYSKFLLIPDAIDYYKGANFKYVKFIRDNNKKVSEIIIKFSETESEIFRRL